MLAIREHQQPLTWSYQKMKMVSLSIKACTEAWLEVSYILHQADLI